MLRLVMRFCVRCRQLSEQVLLEWLRCHQRCDNPFSFMYLVYDSIPVLSASSLLRAVTQRSLFVLSLRNTLKTTATKAKT